MKLIMKHVFFAFLEILLLGVNIQCQAASECLFMLKRTGLCHDCASGYYRESGKFDEINATICKARTNTRLRLSYFVTNSSCMAKDPCDGSTGSPFDSFEKALSEAHRRSNTYIESEINIYLLGDFHYILRGTLSEISSSLFRGINASVEISPWLCSVKDLPGCFASADKKAKIIIKNALFSLFTSRSLTLRNIEFLANDVHLFNSTNLSTLNICLNQSKICCNFDSLDSLCSFTSKNMTFDLISTRQEIFGFLTIKPIFAQQDSAYQTPNLMIENCSFKNFYPALSNGGWTALIVVAHSGGANVYIKNTDFINLRFLKGILWSSDYRTLFPSLAWAEQISYLSNLNSWSSSSLSGCYFEKYDVYNLFGLASATKGSMIIFENLIGDIALDRVLFNNLTNSKEFYQILEISNCPNVAITGTGFQNMTKFSIMNILNTALNLVNTFFQKMSTNYGIIAVNSEVYMYHILIDSINSLLKDFLSINQRLVVINDTIISNNYNTGFSINDCKIFKIQDCSILNHNMNTGYTFTIKNTPLDLTSLRLDIIRESGESHFIWITNPAGFVLKHSFYMLNINNYKMASYTSSLIKFQFCQSEDELWSDGLFIENSDMGYIFDVEGLGRVVIVNTTFIDMIYEFQGSTLLDYYANTQKIYIDGVYIRKFFVDYYFINEDYCDYICEFILKNVFMQEILIDASICIEINSLLNTLIQNFTIIDPWFITRDYSRILGFWSGHIQVFGLTIEYSRFKCSYLIMVQVTDILIDGAKITKTSQNNDTCIFLRAIHFYPARLKNIILQNIAGFNTPTIMDKNGIMNFHASDEYFFFSNYLELYLYNISIQNCKNSYYGLVGLINVELITIKNLTIINDKNSSGGFTTVGGGLSILYSEKVIIDTLNVINMKSEKYGAILLSGILNIKIDGFYAINSSSAYGGAVGILKIPLLFLHNVRLIGCKSLSDGGAFIIKQSNVDIFNITAVNISALEQGGVFNLYETTLNLSQSCFSYITASIGGAFYTDAKTSLKIYDSNFTIGEVKLTGPFAYFTNAEAIDCVNLTIENIYNPKASGNIYVYSDSIKNHSFKNIIIKNCNLNKGTFLSIEGDCRIRIENIEYFQNEGVALQSTGRSKSFLEIVNINAYSNGLLNLGMEAFLDLYLVDFKLRGNSFIRDSRFSILIISAGFSTVLFENLKILSCTNLYNETTVIVYKITSSTITLLGSDFKYSQGLFSYLQAKESEISMKNIFISDCLSSESACLIIALGTLFMSDSKFERVKGKLAGALHLITTSASLTTIDFSSSSIYDVPKEDASLIKIGVSYSANVILATNLEKLNITIKLVGISFKASQLSLPLASFSKITSVELVNCIHEPASESQSGSGLFSESSNMRIRNCSFLGLRALAGSALRIINLDSALKNAVEIFNSSFVKNSAKVGGAILLVGKLTCSIEFSFFEENRAENLTDVQKSGIAGCLYFSCLDCKDTNIHINSNTFNKNSAEFFAPTIFSQTKISNESNVFSDNTDELNFTNTIAGLPIDKNLSTFIYKADFYKEFSDLPERIIISGAEFDLNLTLKDYFGQTLLFDKKSQSILLKPSNSNAIISREFFESKNGFHSFRKVKINTRPNNSIDLILNIEFFEEDNFPFIYERNPDNNLVMNVQAFVRPCIRGELFVYGDSRCELCQRGEFSLSDPMNTDFMLQKCQRCPDNAVCSSGDSITPMKGFWRAHSNTSKIIECLTSSACLGDSGGLESYSKVEKSSGRCASHHEGPFCSKCQAGFVKISSNGLCQDCENNPIFYVKFALVFGFVMIYIYLQIRIMLNNTSKAYSGILLKQLLTHFQQISMISILDLGWTPDFKSFFFFQSYLSFISEDLFNFDCFSMNIDGSSFIKSVIIMVLLPIVLSLAFLCLLIIEQIVDVIRSKVCSLGAILSDFKICVIVIVYMLFPEITRKCFSLLNCIDIDDSGSTKLLRLSPDIECWTPYHYNYILMLALPGFLVWGILYPLGMLLMMYRGRIAIREIIKNSNKGARNLQTYQSSHTQEITNSAEYKRNSRFSRGSLDASQNLGETGVILRFIYKGYKEDYYYWEIIIFVKKILLIFIGSFTDFFPNESKATILLAIISIFLLLQVRVDPFELKYLNTIEFMSLFVTFLTANFGLLLYSDDFKKASIILLGIMIIINILFVFYWAYIFVFLKKQAFRKK